MRERGLDSAGPAARPQGGRNGRAEYLRAGSARNPSEGAGLLGLEALERLRVGGGGYAGGRRHRARR